MDEEFIDRPTSPDEWFDQLNAQLRVVNQYTAFFACELSVNPDDNILKDSTKFNAIKSKWVNSRCAEAKELLELVSFGESFARLNATLLQSVASILCVGPKFTGYQSNELTKILYSMQQTFTNTQVCIPKHFDICLNLDRIWDVTYVHEANGDLRLLDLSEVAPKRNPIRYELNYFSGNVSDDYYIFGGSLRSGAEESIAKKILAGPMLCFDGEPDLERIMKGDFGILQRDDCALRFNEIFRWAWESWRMAVGTRIGDVYPTAVQLMNLGASNNGELSNSSM